MSQTNLLAYDEVGVFIGNYSLIPRLPGPTDPDLFMTYIGPYYTGGGGGGNVADRETSCVDECDFHVL